MSSIVLGRDSDAPLAASAWLRAQMQGESLDDESAFRLDLCLTELVANAASHGAATRIEISLVPEAGRMGFRIVDDGVPFDPLDGPLAAPATTLEQAVPGGAGLPLIRAFCDDARYQRIEDVNVVTVRVARHRDDGARVDRPAQKAIREAIDRCPLFAGLAAADRERVARHATIRACPDGEVLMRPGDANRHVAVVLEGTLAIHLDAEARDEPLLIPAGECVGEMSVVDDRPVSALVAARCGCRLLLIEADAFIAHVLPLPLVARRLMATLAARMRIGNARVVARIREAAELERVRRELAFASELQAAMLPHRSPLFPDHPAVDCAGRLRSARAVGGDLFDAFFLDPDHLFVVIGDVCDKGVPAALYMVRTLTLLRSEMQRPAAADPGARLADAVARVNDTLFDGHDGDMFVTLWCGILASGSGRLWYVNAGHLPPVRIGPEGASDWLTGRRNPIVGAAPALPFAVAHTALAPGETLLLYTDGVTEAEGTDGGLFGESRLLALAARCHGTPAETLLDRVFDAVDGFTAGRPAGDDVTVLALARRPAAARPD